MATLAAFAIGTLDTATQASSHPPDDLSSHLEGIRADYGLPGLTAMAIKGGRIIAQGATGVRRQGYAAPITVNDPVNIASCTKWMNGTIAARLVDRGLISWNTRVRDLFANYTTFHSSFHNATLEQILAHRAGVQDGTTWEATYWSQLMNQTGSISQIRRWVAETALKSPPQVAPGNYLYSNQGHTVAACMMEIASGKSWETLIQEEVFIPLEMYGSQLGITHSNNVPPLAVVGHDKVNKSSTPVPRNAMSTSALPKYQASNGAGGFAVCTLQEWGRFLSIHNIDQAGFLQPATLQKIRSPYSGLSQGYGMGVSAVNRTWASPGQALSHSGDIFGQDSVFWTAPGKDLVVMAFTNTRTGDGSAFTALDEVASLMVSSYADATPSGPLLDAEAEFQFATSTWNVAENAGAVIVEVVRSWPGSAAGSVAYTLTPGTAGHNSDFSGTLTGVLNFEVGVLARTIAIPIINDSIPEGGEQFSIHLGFTPFTPANGYSIGSIGSATVIIQDDDVAAGGTLSVSPASWSAPVAGGAHSFSVNASGGWSWNLGPGGTWVSSGEAGNQSGIQTFSYTVAANAGPSPRTATITLTSGSSIAVHTIVQAGTQGGGGDHGGSIATATPVAPNSTTAGVIETAGDNDYFRIHVAGPGILTIRTTGDTDTYGHLLNASGGELASDDDSGGDYNFQIVHAVTTGTYYVRVRHWPGDGTGAYQLVSSLLVLSPGALAPPTGVSAKATGPTKILVRWRRHPSHGSGVTYTVSQKTNGKSWRNLSRNNRNLRHTSSKLKRDARYSYRVTAFDRQTGRISKPSRTVSAKTKK